MPYPTTPRTWVAGDVLTAAQLNAELRDALLGAFPLGPPDVAWTAYTPTDANITVGNGTRSARYTRVGRLIAFQWQLTWGTTTAMGGNASVGIPVAASSTSPFYPLPALLRDAGVRHYVGTAGIGFSTNVLADLFHSEAGNFGIVNATNPFTWGSGDLLFVGGTYEAAT